jgi:hypothetical protein
MKCRYVLNQRENWYEQKLGNVEVKCFQFDDVYGLNKKDWLTELVDRLPVIEPFMEIKELCNCWEAYGSPMCNNGGNYHSVIQLYQITPCISLALFKDTRELFNVEELLYYIIEIDGEPKAVIVAKAFETIQLLKRSELTKFIKKYKKKRDYVVYALED